MPTGRECAVSTLLVTGTGPHGPLVPCPVCDSHEFREVFGSVKRCRRCGLGMVNPRGDFPGEHETEQYFRNEYLPFHLQNLEASMGERRAHIAAITRRFRLPSHPRHLDIGCAVGFMLEQAKQAGWNPTGVETSAFAARYAAERTGCPVFAGTLEQAKFPAENFDVVTLTDVIEHVPEPDRLLAEIYRVLRPGGVLYIVTPNFGSFFVSLYGARAYGIWPDQHVVYFNRRSMQRLLARIGFRTSVTMTKDFYQDNLSRFLRRKTGPSAVDLKGAFASNPWLDRIRRIANWCFTYVSLGDKLVACAQK